ncbi:MAG: Rha family transcriptional regulator [Rhizobium sp.]|nr:Rha family transcriptional regulator [Rhizobium sp.]MCZ8352904.1 Rha family transcriptional regulator [Rhizobium sp.]
MATSKDVAAYFEKRHDVVARAIENLIASEPSIAHNFASIEVEVKIGFGTRKDRAFEMTRDGFTLLAMGFTGKKALQSIQLI